MTHIMEHNPKLEEVGQFVPYFTEAQISQIARYGAERCNLKLPIILIVEDQEFSRKLLESLISRTCVCYSASNAADAVAAYAEYVPSIVFLDVELPDYNGHDLAHFIKQHDPQSYIVMVTANHYASDVNRALANKVQGFIAKPFNRIKIISTIEKYTQTMMATK